MADKDVRIQAVDRTFEIIERLVELGGATGTDVAEAVDLPNSTVHDHLQTLKRLHYVTKQDGEYQASTRFLQIGEQVRRQKPVYDAAKPALKSLAADTGEHVLLLVEEGGLGTILVIEEGENAVQINSYPGIHLRLHTTAMGKCILAHLSEERVNSIIEHYGLPAVTNNTTVEADQLHKELEEIRRDGYSTQKSGEVEGIFSIGTPVLNKDEVLGAIAISGPVHRLEDDTVDELRKKLLQTRNVIEIGLEYS